MRGMDAALGQGVAHQAAHGLEFLVELLEEQRGEVHVGLSMRGQHMRSRRCDHRSAGPQERPGV